ncbi:isochorismatase hydrolase [Kribbella flavida DSM 17836]|uniref:Isochorismatase hydrolase n=1 Tax=Kribbella flavida (strain DSM 17836 / JCM 10339 / NBRC 14399) TaxID=479435 RepID=D2PPL4_KRIFD|nr:isochorismatase family protein [Kribbella flavida]ADB30976.1 isochorismatase hydrolase [Kribbella flavida DSM 17836]
MTLEPRRTALVLIDLMPRIIALETAPLSGADVLERCIALAQATRSVGGLVVHVRVERPGVGIQPEGSELAPELDPQPGDLEIVKRSVGAFPGTGLDEALRSRDIDTIALGGIATNFGVESTGRAADDHGYRTIYLSDAMTGLDRAAHDFAISYVFPRFGTVTTGAEYVAALSPQRD